MDGSREVLFARPAELGMITEASSEGEPSNEIRMSTSMILTTFDEAEWVRRAKTGDTGAFLDLVKHFDRHIFRIARQITQNGKDAGDVLIQTFLEACSHLNDCQDNTKFYAWLATIAVKEALLKFRKEGRAFLDAGLDARNEVVVRETSAWQGNPQERHTREEFSQILDRAMESLEPTDRAVFVLRDIEEMSTEDTVQALNLPGPVVKWRLLRARLQLREELTSRFK